MQSSKEQKEYQERVTRKREKTTIEKSKREALDNLPPSITGKYHCIAPLEYEKSVEFPTFLKLTLTSVGLEDAGLMGKKIGGRGWGLGISSAWEKSDLEGIECVIKERPLLLKSCRFNLVESMIAKGVIEE